MNTISQNLVVTSLLVPADQAAGVDSDSVHMGHVSLIALLLNIGALTGDAILKVFSGATDGAKTTALTFRYRTASADTKSALADQHADEATSAALTLTAATFDARMLEIEVRDSEMTDGEPWLTVEIGAEASAMFCGITAVAVPRHPGNTIPSMLAA